MAPTAWQNIVKKKREETAAKIPAAWCLPSDFVNQFSEQSSAGVLDIPRKCGLLTAKELEITEKYDATALLAKLASKELSCYEVTEAFSKRAVIADQLTCCLTETLFDQAFARAKALDEHLARTGKPIGPLHGLPISLKDSFNVKGTYSTIGYVSFIEREPDTTNSPLVDVLLGLGAVLYVKTNLPQTLMTAESHNNVFGRTRNPHKLWLGAGGSSGGEGALVAMRGSVMGIGTDIGGSIRIPAICCGDYGFNPTVHRIPFAGQTGPGRKGMAGIAPRAGPITTSARDLELLFKSVVESDPWMFDQTVIAAPFHEATPAKKLRLGLYLEDPKFPLHPAVLRALKTAVKKLEAAGHEIIALQDVPPLEEMMITAMRFFELDSSQTRYKNIDASGEPRIPSLAKILLPAEAYLPNTLDSLYDLNLARVKYMGVFRNLIVKNQLDCILMPGYQGTAQPHDDYGRPAYTVLLNLLDYPSTIIPFGKANRELDKEFVRDVEYIPPYDATKVEGAPSCVQVVGRHMRDEVLLKHSQMVDEVLNK